MGTLATSGSSINEELLETTTDSSQTLQAAIEGLKRNLTSLANNLGRIEHSVETECSHLTLRLHYPSFRQRKPMLAELIDAISIHVINFCLPRHQVNELQGLYGRLSVDEFMKRHEVLRQEAYDLFKRAQRATNRNGEAGELMLYLLTEWLLGAPQIIAKMGLKTNRDMVVHGADGVHVRYCPNSGRLFVYWGEAKLYKEIGGAITAAAESIAESLSDEKLKHEIALVKRYLNLSDMSEGARGALLEMLDPFGPGYADRHDIVTCLIAFDFEAYDAVLGASEDAEVLFRSCALARLAEIAPKIEAALKGKSLAHQPVELFLIPVPSVERMRELFQDKIGWTDAPAVAAGARTGNVGEG